MNHEIISNELDERNQVLIEKVEEMEKEIENLKNELEFLKGIISNKNKKIFGASSEKVDADQLCFFNEAEKHSDSKVEEPTVEEITYKRAKKSNNIGKKDNLANLERKIIEHKLEGDDLICDKCGSKLVEIVENVDKEALKKSRGVIGCNYCEQIYKLEKELRETYSFNEDYYDIRFDIRNKKLEPILDNFIEYI